MKHEIINKSLALSEDTFEQADNIAKTASLASRNEAFEWSIGVASQITEAVKQGFKVVLTKEGRKDQEFILGAANVQPQGGDKKLLIQLSPENIVRLRQISENPKHPAAPAVKGLANTVFQPTPREVESKFIFVLIYWAIRSGEEIFYSLVRDIVTVLVTDFDSFKALVEAEYFKPQFDTHFIEQQFLADEYRKEKHRQMTP